MERLLPFRSVELCITELKIMLINCSAVGGVRTKPELFILTFMVNTITDINVNAFNNDTAVCMTVGAQGV